MLDSIVWYNLPSEILSIGTSTPDIRCCVVRSGWPGEGNFDEDPLFARPGSWIDPDDPTTIFGAGISWSVWADGDYHLRSQTGRWDPTTQEWVQDDVTSPCIDAGSCEDSLRKRADPQRQPDQSGRLRRDRRGQHVAGGF